MGLESRALPALRYTFLEIGWLLVAVLTPLWINLWGSQPFDPAKINLLRWLVWLMGAVWIGVQPRLTKVHRHTVSGAEETIPRTLLLPLMALGGTAVLTTVTATNPALALWGSYPRAYGLLTLLSYLLLALVVADCLRTMVQAKLLLGTMAATTLPIIFLGVLQWSGHDPLQLITDARSPVYATLGRSNFVGAYLALLLPLTVALALGATRRHVRVGLALLALGQLLLIGLTLARAAWLGAGAGLLLLLVGCGWPRLSHSGRKWTAGLVGLLFAGGALLAARAVLLADAGSIAARRTIWQATMTLIGERPLLGVGLDNLSVNFMRVYPPELVYYQGRQVIVDRAHNWLLDTAVTMGTLGLFVTLWLWVTFFGWGWRAAQHAQAAGKRQRSLLLLGSLAALAGNLAGNLFSFDTASTAAGSWLLFAVVISLGRGTISGRQHMPGSRWRVGVVGAAIAVALMVGWWANGRFLLADAAQQRSIRVAQQGNLEQALSAALRAVTCWPQEPVYWQQLAQVYGTQGNLALASDAWQQALALRPRDPALWGAKGAFYAHAVQRGDRDAFFAARAAYDRAIALAPNIARFHTAQGQLYLLIEEWETAVDHLERAVALDATDSVAWRLLANAYHAQGKSSQALAAQQEARRWEGSE